MWLLSSVRLDSLQVDKKIIIDVLMYAWERAARGQAACVVLVTNDGDYAVRPRPMLHMLSTALPTAQRSVDL